MADIRLSLRFVRGIIQLDMTSRLEQMLHASWQMKGYGADAVALY